MFLPPFSQPVYKFDLESSRLIIKQYFHSDFLFHIKCVSARKKIVASQTNYNIETGQCFGIQIFDAFRKQKGK